MSEKHDLPKYEVMFRISGEDLDPFYITSLLSIEPDIAHRKGDERLGKSKKGKIIKYAPFTNGLWGIKSKEIPQSNIEKHLDYLLKIIEPKREEILHLIKQGYKIDFYCGYFFSHEFQAGIKLNSLLLSRISSLSIDIGIDIHVIP